MPVNPINTFSTTDGCWLSSKMWYYLTPLYCHPVRWTSDGVSWASIRMIQLETGNCKGIIVFLDVYSLTGNLRSTMTNPTNTFRMNDGVKMTQMLKMILLLFLWGRRLFWQFNFFILIQMATNIRRRLFRTKIFKEPARCPFIIPLTLSLLLKVFQKDIWHQKLFFHALGPFSWWIVDELTWPIPYILIAT